MIKLLSLFMISSVFASPFRQNISDQELRKHGSEVYAKRCIGCHGVKGDGKGPASVFLDPKPRNFIPGVFKFKSTPNEALPSDKDLMRTLSHGVLGTSMPNFRLLPEVSRYAVIQYIKSFSSEWNNKELKMASLKGAPFPMQDFKNHNTFLQRAKKGRAHFVENCVVCHGVTGLGNGEGGEGLENDWGYPIKPANLRKPFIKSGKSVEDIYRVLLSGVAGTPMPAFKDVISDEDLWDLAAYVLYLRGEEQGVYKNISKEKLIPEIKASELE